jgi:anti-sigma B factor antagonist
MELKEKRVGEAAVLELNGRFDAYEAPQVVGWLEKNVSPTLNHVVVHLGQVNFVDSSALASLVKGMKRCREQGGDLRVCTLSQPVRVIFELTRLDRAIQIHPTEEEALAAFNG